MSKDKIKVFLIRNSRYIVFFIIVLISIIASKGLFIEFTNLRNILVQNSVIMTIAFGQFLVILTGGIDLSVGGILALSAVVCAKLFSGGHSFFISIFLSLLVGTICGFLNGVLVAKLKIPPFLSTLSMMGITYGIAKQVSFGSPIYDIPEKIYIFGGNEYLGPFHTATVICFSVFLFVLIFSEHTSYGKYLYAIGGNERVAWLAGINTDKVKICSYTILGLLCAIGAIMHIGRTGLASPDFGVDYNLNSIAAVIIGGGSLSGGEGKITGVLMGALLLGILNNLMNILNISVFFQSIIIGTVLLGAIYINLLNSRIKI